MKKTTNAFELLMLLFTLLLAFFIVASLIFKFF